MASTSAASLRSRTSPTSCTSSTVFRSPPSPGPDDRKSPSPGGVGACVPRPAAPAALGCVLFAAGTLGAVVPQPHGRPARVRRGHDDHRGRDRRRGRGGGDRRAGRLAAPGTRPHPICDRSVGDLSNLRDPGLHPSPSASETRCMTFTGGARSARRAPTLLVPCVVAAGYLLLMAVWQLLGRNDPDVAQWVSDLAPLPRGRGRGCHRALGLTARADAAPEARVDPRRVGVRPLRARRRDLVRLRGDPRRHAVPVRGRRRVRRDVPRAHRRTAHVPGRASVTTATCDAHVRLRHRVPRRCARRVVPRDRADRGRLERVPARDCTVGDLPGRRPHGPVRVAHRARTRDRRDTAARRSTVCSPASRASSRPTSRSDTCRSTTATVRATGPTRCGWPRRSSS